MFFIRIMTNLLLSAFLSAGFAGLAAISTTVLIERCGGVVGGILGYQSSLQSQNYSTMPTTVVPASIGIAYNSKENSEFGRAMFTVASAMVIYTL